MRFGHGSKNKCNRGDAEARRLSRRKFRRLILSPCFSMPVCLGGGILIVSGTMLLGCLGYPSNPAATQPVTITDTATTQPDFRFDKPSNAVAFYDSFATLFKTCENVCRDYGFKIDRVDYRTGTLTTEPLESAQAFEPWRPDVQTLAGSRDSTIASVRRTLRFDIRRDPDGRFVVSPKCLVERQTVQEQRITSVALYKGAAPNWLRRCPVRNQGAGRRLRDSTALLVRRWPRPRAGGEARP